MSYNPLHDRDAGRRWGDRFLAYTTGEVQLQLNFYTCRFTVQLNVVPFAINVVE